MYDRIGDIHGHADELEALLQKLGYTIENGVYRHPNHTAIFLGDFIDRGPKVRETLQIVRAMVEAGSALAVMGNHEFNFLCYNHQMGSDKWLRPHNEDNDNQVASTLTAFKDYPEEKEDYLNWFYTLPLFLELEGFRVVHACWKPEVIDRLSGVLSNGRLLPTLLEEAGTKDTELYNDIEIALKGVEVPIDEPFTDTDGKLRHEARVRWWLNPKGLKQRDYYFRSSSDAPIPAAMQSNWYYPMDEKPVFIGHYWMMGAPELEAPNVCCVDYSIGRKGSEPQAKLVAYRWDGGPLDASNFVFVE